MKKYFYSHIVETTSISLTLADLDMTKEERSHLVTLAEENIHHSILDTILSELSAEDKKVFLSNLSEDNHEKIWRFLNTKVKNAQDKIKKTAEDLIEELQKDIEEAKTDDDTKT